MEPSRIGLVKVSPSLTAHQLAAVLADSPDGIVLESYGSGTAPMQAGGLTQPLRDAVQRGTPIFVVTQCADGGVDLGRYAVGAELAHAGALSGGDMTTEAALGKLGALTRAGYRGDELRALLQANIFGERA